MMLAFGIMQGRLSPKEPTRLQSFPFESWQAEFERAAQLGFAKIEWLFDETDPDINPLASRAGLEAAQGAIRASGVNVETACLHYFIHGQLSSASPVERQAASDLLLSMLEQAARIGVKYAVLPAMESAALDDSDAAAHFAEAVGHLIETRSPACGLAIESDAPADRQLAILDQTSAALGVCFDVGNLTAAGRELVETFNTLQSRVVEVHIKDRVLNGGSRLLGDGDVDFGLVARLVGDAGFTGPVVLETPVFEDWEASASHNLRFVSEAMEGSAR